MGCFFLTSVLTAFFRLVIFVPSAVERFPVNVLSMIGKMLFD